MKKILQKDEELSAEGVRVIDGGEKYVSGSDMSSVYIDMLCERFRNRGISTKVNADAKRQAEKEESIRRLAPRAYEIEFGKVSPYDKKYRTGRFDGKSYMSSDDFAAYYRDLRNYKLPKYYTRPVSEYRDAEEKAAREKAEIEGIPPKKVMWLAVKQELSEKLKKLRAELNAEGLKKFGWEWFPADKAENRVEGKKRRIPKGIISSFSVVTLSLLMIVCSSVMVSRAQSRVSELENEISSLEEIRDELNNDLEIKNDMLMIKEIATGSYGMVSREYVNSKYIEMDLPEQIQTYSKPKKESTLSSILRAIGLKKE